MGCLRATSRAHSGTRPRTEPARGAEHERHWASHTADGGRTVDASEHSSASSRSSAVPPRCTAGLLSSLVSRVSSADLNLPQPAAGSDNEQMSVRRGRRKGNRHLSHSGCRHASASREPPPIDRQKQKRAQQPPAARSPPRTSSSSSTTTRRRDSRQQPDRRHHITEKLTRHLPAHQPSRTIGWRSTAHPQPQPQQRQLPPPPHRVHARDVRTRQLRRLPP